MSTNMYIKFENPAVTGSSTATDHKGEFEVLSWNHGFVQPTSARRSSDGSGTVEQAAHSNLSFTTYLESGSSQLMEYCWRGKQIGKATLTCYRNDVENKPVEYLRVVMEHVVIANYSVSGGPGDIPIANVGLDYGIIQYNYKYEKHVDGSAEGNKPMKHNLETRSIE
jgi:type VI secretion system secreted protein Hcp